jgi:hypothetical protein
MKNEAWQEIAEALLTSLVLNLHGFLTFNDDKVDSLTRFPGK